MFYTLWFKKTRLETPFKGDDVKAFVKPSTCENLIRNTHGPASLKIKRHFSTAAAFGNSVFFKMENLVR